MLWWGGLRGAVAFALAIRNTESVARQLMLSSVLVVAVVTVVVNGGLTTWVITKLGIPVGVVTENRDDAAMPLDGNNNNNNNNIANGDNNNNDERVELTATATTTITRTRPAVDEQEEGQEGQEQGGRSWLVRKWHSFDVNYMKPFFTTRAGPVNVNFPRCFCCHAVNNCCDVQTTSTIADDDNYQNRLDSTAPPNAMKRLMTYL